MVSSKGLIRYGKLLIIGWIIFIACMFMWNRFYYKLTPVEYTIIVTCGNWLGIILVPLSIIYLCIPAKD